MPAAPREAPRPALVSPALVPISELPPAQRELLEAYGRGGADWESARARARADPALARFLVDNLVLEMARAHRALSGPEPERGRAACERAQEELARVHGHALPVLVQVLGVPDSILATLAHQTLQRIGRPANAALLAALEDPSPRLRQRAAAALADLPHDGPGEAALEARLAALAHGDPEWWVRAQAALALGARGARSRETTPPRRALEEALSDSDVAVAESAAAALAQLEDPRAVPALIRCLARGVQAGELRLVRASTRALQSVSGVREELDLEEWRAWWDGHRRELEQRASAPRASRGEPR